MSFAPLDEVWGAELYAKTTDPTADPGGEYTESYGVYANDGIGGRRVHRGYEQVTWPESIAMASSALSLPSSPSLPPPDQVSDPVAHNYVVNPVHTSQHDAITAHSNTSPRHRQQQHHSTIESIPTYISDPHARSVTDNHQRFAYQERRRRRTECKDGDDEHHQHIYDCTYCLQRLRERLVAYQDMSYSASSSPSALNRQRLDHEPNRGIFHWLETRDAYILFCGLILLTLMGVLLKRS